RDVGRALREEVGTRRVPDPFGHGLVGAGEPQRLGAPALDQVAGVEPRHIGLVEEREDEAEELVEAVAVPGREVTERDREEVERAGALGPLEMGRDRIDALLGKTVDAPRRRAQEVGVADEERELPLGGRAAVESSPEPARQLDRRYVFPPRLEAPAPHTD